MGGWIVTPAGGGPGAPGLAGFSAVVRETASDGRLVIDRFKSKKTLNMAAMEDPARAAHWRKIGGAVLGLALLAAAVGVAARGVDLAALRAVPRWVLPAIAVGVGVNLLATATLMLLITRGFAGGEAVRWGEMVALSAWSGLLNYVPVIRAGLWGRAAYLKRVHGLAVRDSVVILLITLGLAAAVLGALGVLGTVLRGWWFWAGCGLAGAVLSVLVIAGARRVPGRFPRLGPQFDAAKARPGGWVPLRLLDLAAAAGRLWLGFYAVGHVITVREAVVLTCASLLVKLTGLTPNGLGLSEWAVAAVAAAVSPVSAASAAAAALVDRAVEVLMAVVAGLIGWAALRRSGRWTTGGGRFSGR